MCGHGHLGLCEPDTLLCAGNTGWACDARDGEGRGGDVSGRSGPIREEEATGSVCRRDLWVLSLDRCIVGHCHWLSPLRATLGPHSWHSVPTPSLFHSSVRTASSCCLLADSWTHTPMWLAETSQAVTWGGVWVIKYLHVYKTWGSSVSRNTHSCLL